MRPRTSSSTSRPSRVYPVTQATPPQAPMTRVKSTAATRLGISASSTRNAPAQMIESPKRRRREKPSSSRGPSHMPAASPTKTAPKRTPKPACPAPRSCTNVCDSPTTNPAAPNAPSMPRTRPRTSGVLPTNRQPSRMLRSTLPSRVCSPAGRRRHVEPQDHQSGDEERRGVEVDREDDRVEVQRRREVVHRAREQRHAGVDDRRERSGAVGGDQADLIRRLEPLRGHEVGDRRVLRGHPEQRDALDENGGDVEPGQRADQGDRGEEREPEHVAEHERPAPVEPVRDGAGERTQQHGRGQPEDEDAGDGEVLRGVRAAGQVLGEGGGGEQAEPVAEARAAQRDPQPAEGLDPQDGGDVVLGRRIVGPVPARVGRRRIPGVGRACRRPQIGGGRQTRFRPVGGRCRPPS